MTQCKELIITEVTRGTDEFADPFRKVTQVFEKDGTLVAEKDDYAEDRFTMDDLLEFARYCNNRDLKASDMQDVEDWIINER